MIAEIIPITEELVEEACKNPRMSKAPGLEVCGRILAAGNRSRYSWVGKINGKVVCVFGVESDCLLGSRGYLWMATTAAADEHPFVFARHSQLILEHLRGEFTLLCGYVDASYTRSIRWLRWLDFTVPSAITIKDGLALRRFEWVRKS